LITISSCGSEPTTAPTETPTISATPIATPSNTPEPTQPDNAAGQVEETPQLITTPTPAPTATPGPLADLAEQLAIQIGVTQVRFLGLTGEDWINLIISIIIFLVSLLLVARLLYALLKRVVKSTPTKYDQILLEKIRPQIFWFLAVIGLQYGTIRLIFLQPAVKQWLNQLYGSLYVVIFTVVAWKLLDIGVDWYRNEVEAKHPEHQHDTILVLGQRVGKFVILSVSFIMILSLFNVNVDVLIASLGVVGLAFSLAAQDSLSNLISGVLISLDQPFRVGDRIEIQGLGTWGDVIDIGLRSTRIRTRDNIMVIVPNSKIGADQVINYSYPDPQYRIQMEINIPYGEEVERIRKIIVEAVSRVHGVLPDKPVEALYVEMGGTGMVFRIRWWIESYVDTRRMFDQVNTALQSAFDQEGIVIPNPAYDIRLQGNQNDNRDAERGRFEKHE
jgi:small-conductance mechanosensitive channel